MAQGNLHDPNDGVEYMAETPKAELNADNRTANDSAAVPPELPKRSRQSDTNESLPLEEIESGSWAWFGEATHQMPSWLASMIVHMAFLILLAWFTLPPAVADRMVNHLVASTDDKGLEKLDNLDNDPFDDTDLETLPEEVLLVEESAGAKRTEIKPIENLAAPVQSIDINQFGFNTAPKHDPMAVIGGFSGDALSGRGKGRQRATKIGATRESEKAVDAALEWLAKHQFADGGWSFAHNLAPQCRDRCGNSCDPRFASARNAATGLALLPFLGAGQTHKEGKYQKVVRSGLYFLTSRQNPHSGSLWESGGRMYSHGIASIALCEAYAMTRDEALHQPAQGALNFICYAQDPIGGGWRYNPREAGDTSVVGWQIMALKSGHMAYLTVPPITIKKASAFLDSVQSASGANYGYLLPGEGPSTEATTAIGVLCRMYLGAKRTQPDLDRGVQWLSGRGPNSNLYYDYYATQVMHHWEGAPWKKWNARMRDELVVSQAKKGHEAGSWYIPGNRNNRMAGRLYCTSLATMILEVYYRHMPIYAKQSTQGGFPSDEQPPAPEKEPD